MFEAILYEVKDNIAFITFNRPKQGNAFSETSFREIPEALSKANEDTSVRAIVLTGKGKLFCGGGDVNQFKEILDDPNSEGLPNHLVDATGQLSIAIRNCPKPIISSINGAAAGAGLGVALASDFRIMEESSTLITSFIFMGFPGDTATSYYLQKILGTAKTNEMMMLSPKVKGKEAKELGLSTLTVEDGTLEEATKQFAQKVASLPTKALAQHKKILNEFFYKDLSEFTSLETKNMVEASKTDDHAEAVVAFLEKRQANFTGR